MRRKLIFIGPAAILGMLLIAFIGGTVVQLLWNWLLPPIFGWPAVTFWQALGLLALCRILFGGFGFHRSGRSHFGGRMRERWEQMTPEERDRLRRSLRERWRGEPPLATDVKGSE